MINTCYYAIFCTICTTNPHIFKARFSWVTELENIELNIISNITTNSPSLTFLHGITVETHERVVIN